MSDPLVPRDHAEAIALFRAEVIGALTRSELSRGDLATAIRDLAARRFLPPRRRATRCFAVSTLERWYYADRRYPLHEHRLVRLIGMPHREPRCQTRRQCGGDGWRRGARAA